MNLVDTHIGRLALAAGRPSRGEDWANSLHVAAGALIGWSAVPAAQSLRLARSALSVFFPVGTGDPRACAQCGAVVRDGDPFIRYHGEYYHAHRCAEDHPPADWLRRILAAETTT
jgi:hypothetical protein